MAKVPKVLGEEHAPKFRDMLAVSIGNGATRQSPIFRFPKREACLMAMSYSYELQAKVFDRMTQLEQGATDPRIPKNFGEALRLAAGQAEEIAKKDALLAVAGPKAAALDRLARETDGAVCLRVASKLAQVPEKQYLNFLKSERWIFRHHHSQTWLGHSEKEQAGYLELKKTRVIREDGSEKVVEQVLITPRGQARAAELIERKAPWLVKVANQAPTGTRRPPANGAHQ
jgi:phage antirepressor YoqD-like protein